MGIVNVLIMTTEKPTLFLRVIEIKVLRVTGILFVCMSLKGTRMGTVTVMTMTTENMTQ